MRYIQLFCLFQDIFSANGGNSVLSGAGGGNAGGSQSYADTPTRQGGGSLAPGAPIGGPPGQSDSGQGASQQSLAPAAGGGLPA